MESYNKCKAYVHWAGWVSLLWAVQFRRTVVSDALWRHGLQHVRLSCPSPTPGVYSNTCPLSRRCHPPSYSLLSPSPLIYNLAQHLGLFSGSVLHIRWPNFQLQHQSFQWIFRTDFFRMDCLDLLAVQGTFQSLLQHHSSKASILWCSAFFIFQLSS